MAVLVSWLLTKLFRQSKQFTGWLILFFGWGWLILDLLGLTSVYTTAAIASIALQTSIQTHNFIQNWTKDAHTMWVTQAQINEKVQDEIQELRTDIQWVRDQLIDLQKQMILKCDGNSTQFCVTPVQFNHRAYNWEQIKFHVQNVHDNASLNVQLLQKKKILNLF